MKPILFNTGMVRAILDGYKTATRRVVKPQPRCELRIMPDGAHKGEWHEYNEEHPFNPPGFESPWGAQYRPPYQPGDILYVRETWAYGFIETPDQPGYSSEWFEEVDKKTASNYLKVVSRYFYRADMDDADAKTIEMRWRPSIHMPKEAARIFLCVTDVRLERLQEMTCSDMQAEGVIPATVKGGQWQQWQQDYMRTVWDATVNPAKWNLCSWNANPWVWVIEFERIEKNP